MLINGEDLPRPDNRITLSSTLRDAHGLPVAHVHCEEQQNDVAFHRYAHGQGRRI